jgi:hypothetical protein
VPSRVKIPLSRTLHFVLLHSRSKLKKKRLQEQLNVGDRLSLLSHRQRDQSIIIGLNIL